MKEKYKEDHQIDEYEDLLNTIEQENSRRSNHGLNSSN